MEFKHQPVLVKEVLQFLPEKSRVIIDGTLGGGGHTRAMLKKLSAISYQLSAKIIGIDRDLEAIFAAKKNLAEFESQTQSVLSPKGMSSTSLSHQHYVGGIFIYLTNKIAFCYIGTDENIQHK